MIDGHNNDDGGDDGGAVPPHLRWLLTDLGDAELALTRLLRWQCGVLPEAEDSELRDAVATLRRLIRYYSGMRPVAVEAATAP